MFTQSTQNGEYDPNQTQSEVSFVLERNVAASTPGTKLGLFSLALVCCICCFSSFFSTTADVKSPGFHPVTPAADDAHFTPSHQSGEGYQLQGADAGTMDDMSAKPSASAVS